MEVTATDILLDLVSRGGPVGLILAILILVVGYFIRGKVFSMFGGQTSDERESHPENEFNQKLDSIESKVKEIEHEMQSRPNRNDYHNLQLSVTKINGRIDRQVDALNRIEGSVIRMEDFLLNYDNRKGE